MSGNPDDERIEELRKQKMQELQEQAEGGNAGDAQAQAEAQEAAREQAEAQKQAMLKQHLTDGARQRLNAVQMSKPEFADKVEQQIVALAQSGRIQDRIDEDQMRDLLKELSPDSRSFDIRRR
ncbi:MAG: DNA-binding protein [Haloplanus sp.]